MTPARVLLVGHNPVLADRLGKVLRAAAGIELVEEVFPQAKVLAAVRSLGPDAVLLDLQALTPPVDAFLTGLLEGSTVAIIAVLPPGDQDLPAALFRALGAGRLDLVRPPVDRSPESAEKWDRALVDLTRAIARPRSTNLARPLPLGPGPAPRQHRAQMIGIASSTGGPPALHRILAALPADLPVPLLLAQHITPGFVAGLQRWLTTVTPLELVVAQSGMDPLPGRVYLAPDRCDLGLGPERHLRVRPSPGIHSPSGDHLLLSMAEVLGAGAAGVVLTGMGDDGAQGLLAIHRAGGGTLAQDEGTSIIFGMPKAAIEAGGAGQVVPLGEMAAAICALAGHPAPAPRVPPWAGSLPAARSSMKADDER